MPITLSQQLDILARAIENAANEADEAASVAYREKRILADLLYDVRYDLAVSLAAVNALQRAQDAPQEPQEPRRELSEAELEANIRKLEDARERADFGPGADGFGLGELYIMSPCCAVGLIEAEAVADDGLIIECGCGKKYIYAYVAGGIAIANHAPELAPRWHVFEVTRKRTNAEPLGWWVPVDMPTAILASPEEVAAHEAAQDEEAEEYLAVPLKAPARCNAEGCGWEGLASSIDCPSCGALSLRGISPVEIAEQQEGYLSPACGDGMHGDCHGGAYGGMEVCCCPCHRRTKSARDAYAQERESLRRQRANFNAIADGFGPIYPDEY